MGNVEITICLGCVYCFFYKHRPKSEDNRWCLFLDYYGFPGAGQGYVPFVADTLASGNFVRADGVIDIVCAAQLDHVLIAMPSFGGRAPAVAI